MTVQAIRPDGEVVAGLAAARAAVGSVAAVPVGSLSDEELAASVADASVLENQVGAVKLALLAEVDRRRLAKRLGATGTDAWAASLTGTTRGVMAGGLWLARLLEEQVCRDAGGVRGRGDQPGAGAGDRPRRRAAPDRTWLTVEERRAAEAGLVARAVQGMDAKGLRRAARRMLDKAVSVSREQVDHHEADQLQREEQRAERETNLAMWREPGWHLVGEVHDPRPARQPPQGLPGAAVLTVAVGDQPRRRDRRRMRRWRPG